MVAIGRYKLTPPFLRCDEKVITGTCSHPATDDCCAVIPCKLCLTLEIYPDEYSDAAKWDGEQYAGAVNGHTFDGYWLNEYGTCYFVVEWDGEEVARFEKCGYEDGVRCRGVSGTVTVETGYGETGELTFQAAEKLQLPHYENQPVRCQTLQVSFVLDVTGSMGGVITELIANVLSIVSLIEAASESYQLQLITHKDTVTKVIDFSDDNGAAFIAAVSALSVGGGGNVPEASDYALKEAVESTGWQYDGANSRRLIIQATDAPPGGLDDDIDDPTDLDHLIEQATAAGEADIIYAGVGLGSGASAIAQAVAANGDDARFISSLDEMVERIQGMINTECPDRAPCLEPFCGACTCTNRFLCFTMVGPDGCEYSEIIEADVDYDGCYSPSWEMPEIACGYFTLSGTIALQRNEYTGECELSVPGLDDPVAISGCDPLQASWEVEAGDDPYNPDVYVFSVVGTDCGDCDPPTVDVVGCPCTEMPFCMRYTVSTHSGSTNCDETGSICFFPGTTWSGDDSSESKFAISVYCGQAQGGGFPCDDAPAEGTARQFFVTFKGQLTSPSNTPGDPLNGACGCEPFSLTVLYLNTICGGIGDGLIQVEFTA